jgi:hypothetical protein
MSYNDDDYNAVSAIRDGLTSIVDVADKFPSGDTVWIDISHNDDITRVDRGTDERLADCVEICNDGVYVHIGHTYHGRIIGRHKSTTVTTITFIPWHFVKNIALVHIGYKKQGDVRE